MWRKVENCPKLNKLLERLSNPMVYGVCDEGYLEIGKDHIHRKIVATCLKSIFSKPTKYNNSFSLRYWAFLSERQVKYFEYIFIKIDT